MRHKQRSSHKDRVNSDRATHLEYLESMVAEKRELTAKEVFQMLRSIITVLKE